MTFVNKLIPEEDKKQFEDKSVWNRKGRRWPFPATERTS